MAEPADSKPALVWLKAQAPGFRHDGSEFATLRFAEVVAQQFTLHLVCLATPATTGDPTPHCCPPFTSVTVVRPDHQRSRARRLVLGGWWTVLDRLGVRPLAASVEGCASMRRAARSKTTSTGARIAVAEYWTMGHTLRSTGTAVRVMRLIDVEHLNVLETDGAARGAGRRRAWRSRVVLRAERRSARAATDVLFVSSEDRRDFERVGVAGRFLPVTVRVADEPAIGGAGNRLAFVGSLDWWPNRQGLAWFLDEVMPKVVAERPDVDLRLFGGGEGRGLTERFERANARRMGYVPDLTAGLRECDVAVVPVVGGTGVKTKTLELLAAGLPVVTTRDGARGTAAAHAGAVVVDSAESFAAAVLDLLAEPDRRAQLSAEGMDTVRREHGTSPTLAWVDSIRTRVEAGAP